MTAKLPSPMLKGKYMPIEADQYPDISSATHKNRHCKMNAGIQPLLDLLVDMESFRFAK